MTIWLLISALLHSMQSMMFVRIMLVCKTIIVKYVLHLFKKMREWSIYVQLNCFVALI